MRGAEHQQNQCLLTMAPTFDQWQMIPNPQFVAAGWYQPAGSFDGFLGGQPMVLETINSRTEGSLGRRALRPIIAWMIIAWMIIDWMLTH
jgi:hypothetical protein